MAPKAPAFASCFTVFFDGGDVKSEATGKTREKTKLQNLVRLKSGCYYAHLCLNGKRFGRRSRHPHYSIVESKLDEAQKDRWEHKGKELVPAMPG